MSTIILLSGKAQYGKTTCASLLKSFLEKDNKKVCIIPFANYLKFIAKEYFKWDGIKDGVGRTLLQNLGEDVRKENINFWVDIVINFINVFDKQFDVFIMDDCRHLNEIERFYDFFGFNPIKVRVERLNFNNGLTPDQKLHPSETGLDNYHDWNWIISAPSGIDYLRDAVEVFYKSHYFQEQETII